MDVFLRIPRVTQVVEFGGERVEKREYFPETDVTVSSLLIKAAHMSDSGNYTCMPAHCPPVTAKVYILKGNRFFLTQKTLFSHRVAF